MSIHAIRPRPNKGERKSKRSRWEVRYRDETGRQRSRAFDKKEAAVDFEAEVRSRRQRGDSVTPASATKRLDDVARDWQRARADEVSLATRKKDGSIYDNWVGPYLGQARVGSIKVPTLDDWRQNIRAAAASPEIEKRARGVLSMVLDDVVRRGEIAANPARSLRSGRRVERRRIERIGPAEVEAIRSHFLAAGDIENATLISVLAYVGLRPEEAFALEPANFTGDAFDLREDQTKARTPARLAPIPAPVRAEVTALDLDRPRIFQTLEGGPVGDVDYRNWRKRRFRPAVEAAGLDLRPYDLRHAAASIKLYAGEPLPDVAADLGHSVETLARVYAGEIKSMRGRPRVAVAKAIREARKS